MPFPIQKLDTQYSKTQEDAEYNCDNVEVIHPLIRNTHFSLNMNKAETGGFRVNPLVFVVCLLQHLG